MDRSPGIDIWDGFVDEDGRYAQSGPDVEGQTRRLRTSDGVYFTQAGARKLAHYVEREVQRWLSARPAPVALTIPEEPKVQAPRITRDKKTGLPLIECEQAAAPQDEMTPERVADILLAQEVEWHTGDSGSALLPSHPAVVSATLDHQGGIGSLRHPTVEQPGGLVRLRRSVRR